MVRGVPSRLEGLGSVVRFLSGVWGGALAENGFYACFRSERSHLKPSFKYFCAMVGPHRLHDLLEPGKTSHLPRVDGPGPILVLFCLSDIAGHSDFLLLCAFKCSYSLTAPVFNTAAAAYQYKLRP